MRMIGAVAVCGMLVCVPAQADYIPPFKGNDTGGIIAYALATRMDARQLAVDHCAYYGKVVKFLGVDAQYGGGLYFPCLRVAYAGGVGPAGDNEQQPDKRRTPHPHP